MYVINSEIHKDNILRTDAAFAITQSIKIILHSIAIKLTRIYIWPRCHMGPMITSHQFRTEGCTLIDGEIAIKH